MYNTYMNTLMKQIVALTFAMLCPFIGGLIVPVAMVKLDIIDASMFGTTFGLYSVVWVILWACWFDDSSFQRSL